MARKQKSPIEEAVSQLAGSRKDDRYKDATEGHIAAKKREPDRRTKRVRKASEREVGLRSAFRPR